MCDSPVPLVTLVIALHFEKKCVVFMISLKYCYFQVFCCVLFLGSTIFAQAHLPDYHRYILY